MPNTSMALFSENKKLLLERFKPFKKYPLYKIVKENNDYFIFVKRSFFSMWACCIQQTTEHYEFKIKWSTRSYDRALKEMKRLIQEELEQESFTEEVFDKYGNKI